MKTRKTVTHSYRILGLLALLAGVFLLSACPSAAIGTIDFEDPPLGTVYYVGDTFTDSGYTMTIAPFQWGNGQMTSNGFARIDDQGLAGGSGQDINTNNVNLSFDLGDPVHKLTLNFGEYGGNLNIEINGAFVNFQNFTDINGTTIGNVSVSVVNGSGNDIGQLTLDGNIETFSIGGQELWLDDVALY